MHNVVAVRERQLAVDIDVKGNETTSRNTTALVLQVGNRRRGIDVAVQVFPRGAKLGLKARRLRAETADVVTETAVLALPGRVCLGLDNG